MGNGVKGKTEGSRPLRVSILNDKFKPALQVYNSNFLINL